MERYEHYKPSGVEWIGDIPADWLIKKLKFSTETNNEVLSENTHDDYSFRYIDIGSVDSTGNILDSEEIRFDEAPSRARRLVKHGDTIVSTVRTYLKAIAFIPEDSEDRICSTGFAVVTPMNEYLIPKYLFYLCRSEGFVDEVCSLSKGVSYPAIDSDALKNIVTLIPNLSEQEAIAKYLDEKTRQIDELIANKQKLIELLKEERTAIINQAVTKGIDPNAKLKPSGIEWLGDIPEHWEIKKLKYVASLKSGENVTSDEIRDEGEFPVYGGNGLRGYFTSFTHDGEFILIGRQGALCGNINYASGQFWASEHAVVITRLDDSKLVWLGELLRTMNLNQYSQSAAQPGLAVDRIKNLFIPVPPIREQDSIAREIEKYSNVVNSTIAKIKREVVLIQEYRAALISEVVTGKVRVAKASNVIAFPEKKVATSANVFFKRAVLGTEIVHQLHADETFGHVKFMKVMYLAEHYAELDEIESNYYRQAAGPMDNKLLASVEKQMAANKWYLVTGQKGERKRYVPKEKAGQHTQYFNRYWVEKKQQIQETIDLCKSLDTQQAEIVATVYAVWNDFIIDGKTVTDDEIVSEILTNWSAQKSSISKERWLSAIRWMRTKNFVPKGFGKKTQLIPSKREKK